MTVRTLQSADLERIAMRVGDSLARDASRNALVNPDFSPDVFVAALGSAGDQTCVDTRSDYLKILNLVATM
jgi:hypothetical protein